MNISCLEGKLQNKNKLSIQTTVLFNKFSSIKVVFVITFFIFKIFNASL